METLDFGLLLLRFIAGGIFIAHGYNHAFGAGGLKGTAGWFGSLGMRNAKLQAFLSAVVEIGAGLFLVLGFLTPLASAALIAVSLVAWIIAHRKNGFFIFKDGYEYVLLLAAVSAVLALTGPGNISLDHSLGLGSLVAGWASFAVALVIGIGGAGILLALAWRPKVPAEAT